MSPHQIDDMETQFAGGRVEISQCDPVAKFEHMLMLIQRSLGALKQPCIRLIGQRSHGAWLGPGQWEGDRRCTSNAVGQKRKSEPA